MTKYEQTAAEFIEALKAIAANEYAADNLEAYLSCHFPAWLEKFANTPEAITEKLKEFSKITG